MNNKAKFLRAASVAAVGITLMFTGAFSTAFGQAANDDVGGPGIQSLTSTSPMRTGRHLPRFIAAYMKSRTVDSPRSATVVSITNDSSVTCETSVDWKIGFNGVACTTTLTLAPGDTGDHCSRAIPDALTTCNATCSPELTFDEGNAIIGSASASPCKAIAVSARTYYTTGTSDETLNAITDARIVRVGGGDN
jgi:hypothetical protein